MDIARSLRVSIPKKPWKLWFHFLEFLLLRKERILALMPKKPAVIPPKKPVPLAKGLEPIKPVPPMPLSRPVGRGRPKQ
jgi:hypothetical protein